MVGLPSIFAAPDAGPTRGARDWGFVIRDCQFEVSQLYIVLYWVFFSLCRILSSGKVPRVAVWLFGSFVGLSLYCFEFLPAYLNYCLRDVWFVPSWHLHVIVYEYRRVVLESFSFFDNLIFFCYGHLRGRSWRNFIRPRCPF